MFFFVDQRKTENLIDSAIWTVNKLKIQYGTFQPTSVNLNPMGLRLGKGGRSEIYSHQSGIRTCRKSQLINIVDRLDHRHNSVIFGSLSSNV